MAILSELLSKHRNVLDEKCDNDLNSKNHILLAVEMTVRMQEREVDD